MKRLHLNPIAWARALTFMVLLALDYKHTYEFVISTQTGAQARELVPLFGPLFDWAAVPMSNGVFDALGYAFIVTAVIYFMSNTLAKRLSHNHPSWTYYLALSVGVGISALTNAGTMYYGATGTLIVPAEYIGLVAALLGGVVTAGLFMFASMDAWDMKARVQKAAATRKRKSEDADELERQRKLKYTPKAKRKNVA